MKIQVFGPGCPNCRRLEQNTREALKGFGQNVEVEKVEDYAAMMEAGVLRTPALAVNGRLVLQGQVPPVNQLMTVLADELFRDVA